MLERVTTVLPIPTLQALQAEAQKTSLYHVEIVNGQQVHKPSPKRLHDTVQQRIFNLLRASCPNGLEVYQELNYVCGGQLYVPDILVAPIEARYENGDLVEPPLLAAEVLSPGQTVGQLYDKCLDYLRDGVQNVWIVVPKRAAYVCRSNGDLFSYDILRSNVMPCEIRIADLFADLPAD